MNDATSGKRLRLLYSVSSNLLYVLNDAGTTYTGGFAPGSAHIISNSNGSLDCSKTTVLFSGKT